MKKRVFILKNKDSDYLNIEQESSDDLCVYSVNNSQLAQHFSTFYDAKVIAEGIINQNHERWEFICNNNDIPKTIEEVIIETKIINEFEL